MAGIKHLVESKQTLQYEELCGAIIDQFAVKENINWDSLLPTPQQQELFGGEILRLIADHPKFANQKDIRPISLMRGSISQLLFFFVRLNDGAITKAQIQKITTRFIRGSEANRYIIWFFGNKNETELKVVLSGKEGKKIVLKTLSFGTNQPYYKTYNFIFSEVHAKVNKLFVEPTDLWKTLWTAFDISVVNRNFYNEIKLAFDQLIAQLSRKGNPFKTNEDRVQFAIRLIGRIIFCWFLKRKDVLKEDALSLQAVKVHEKANYYQDLLEPLFFDVLNTPEKERKGGLPKTIARYPFLNGGLFEAQETDYQNNLQLNIDNKWFEDFFGNTLERYNFTVDENSSSNEEIAIDPEMLGRIFENLLAEQNPETGESARKATGSFYTPREVVDYIVEQSISEYLKTSLALPDTMSETLEDFVHTQHLSERLEKYEKQLSDALTKIKVLDPACGSGAFPIGVLQKLVGLKQQLHPKSKNYKLKLDTIQNSIYGVDIQPMAVELSRLRCWLSLVVDEEPTDIKALPNLDFKFVCADSLMPIGKLNHQLDLSSANEKIEQLKELRGEFFISSGKRKREIERKFKAIQVSLNNRFLEWDGKSKLVENLAGWKPFDNLKADWFDAFWMFGINDGFDIVLGNPPYKKLTKNNTPLEQLAQYTNNYNSIKRSNSKNLYTLFIEAGVIFLSDKGTMSLIVPEGLFSTRSYKDCVDVLNATGSVSKITTFTSFVFENAVTGNLVFVYDKNRKTLTEKYHFDANYVLERVIEVTNPVLSKIEQLNTIPLNSISTVFKGMVVADRNDVVGEDPSYGVDKFLLGKSIEKWKVSKVFYTDYKSLNIIGGTKAKAKHDVVPRILIRRTGDNLCCAYLTERALTESTLYSCWSIDPNFDNRYILALLNSLLLTYYIRQLMVTNKQAFPQILMTDLEAVPIVDAELSKKQIVINLVSILHSIRNNRHQITNYVTNDQLAKQMEELIDACVLELYFADEMKNKQIDVLAFVEKELLTVLGDINFEEMPTEAKAEAINKFYTSVSHPDSPIRNRILKFPIASPDILKPILQG